MKLSEYKVPEPVLEKMFRAEVILDDAYPIGEIGEAYQEIVAIKGGCFEGVINGEIIDFGGDWGLFHSGRINEMNTRYLFKTEDGAFISVRCEGKLIMSMEDIESSCSEENVDKDYYFRQAVTFTAGVEKYKWLNEIVAVGTSVILPGGNVCLDVYKVI